MANYTPNMNLKKPLTGEYYDVVAEYNNSMDIIDAEVGGVKTSLAQNTSKSDSVRINVKFPPLGLVSVKGDGTDETAAIQAIFDFAKAQGGATVFFPKAAYRYTKLYLREFVSIEGCGIQTILKALPSAFASSIVIGDAPIQHVRYKNFSIEGLGATNPNQNGLDLTAISQTASPFTGGMWYSDFSNIRISGFDGTQLNLHCSDGAGDMANQFLNFDRVTCFRTANTASRCLKITGQNGQMNFLNCQFDGVNKTVGGKNVELNSLLTNADEIYAIKFDTCTFQTSDLGVQTYYALGVHFDNCYFEDLAKGVLGTNSSRITLNNPRFANITNGGTGYCLKTDTGVLKAYNIFSIGTIDKVIINASGTIDYNVIYGGTTSEGIVQVNGIDANGAISTAYAKLALINTSGTQLKTVTSALPVLDELTIVAWGGSVVINSTGNIALPAGRGNLTLPDKGVARFMKSDLGVTWVLISTTGTFAT